MPEFKKKTALGLRDLPENGQECTHVLLTHSEYDGLLAKVACAERDARSVYTAASQKIAQAERNSAQAKEAAYAEVNAVQKDLEEACRKIEYLNGLNKNLLRIARERANADRKLRPKKTHGIAPETVTATCYGLNHLSFFNSIQFSGKEMLPTLINDDRIYATTDMRFFSKELTKKMGCILNEYLYYFFYREKAVQNILDAHVTRGEVIRDVNKHMIEELSHLDPVKDFDKCLEVYVKWQGQRSAMYMKNETGIRRPDPFTFDLTSHDDGGYAGVALKYIKAQQTGKPVEMIFCVPNNGAIPGLLDSDVVEISCTIQPDGTYLPHAIQNPGEIPMEIIRRVKLYERYASRAIRNRSRDDAITCLMVHPLVNSYSLAETLVDEYLKLNQEYIKEWS